MLYQNATHCCLIKLVLISAIGLSSVGFASPKVSFSDASLTTKMYGADWNKQKVVYSSKLKDADLTISLDQQQYPYLLPIIKDFAQHRQKTIAVSDGTCGVSAGKLRRKNIDVGGFCCPPGPLDRLPGLTFHTLGIASLALIAHPDVAVTNVSTEQAKKVFEGDIQNWSKIDTTTSFLPIAPIVRLHCDKRPGHWRLIVPNKNDFARTKLKVGSIPNMLNHTSKTQGAIGFETLWMIDLLKQKYPVKVLSINGINPANLDALAKGAYPFYRTFNLTTWGEQAKPLAKELLAYLIKHINDLPDDAHGLIGADVLKANGWHFKADELIGEPKNSLFGQRSG